MTKLSSFIDWCCFMVRKYDYVLDYHISSVYRFLIFIPLWVGAILQSPCPSVRPFVRPSIHTFVTNISASTGRNDFIFDIWLWHGDLYRVSPFQVYRTSTFCLPCDLQMNEWGVFLARRSCNILFYIGINFPFITHSCDSYWDKQYNLYEKAFYWY
jgi:hypothetical protein